MTSTTTSSTPPSKTTVVSSTLLKTKPPSVMPKSKRIVRIARVKDQNKSNVPQSSNTTTSTIDTNTTTIRVSVEQNLKSTQSTKPEENELTFCQEFVTLTQISNWNSLSTFSEYLEALSALKFNIFEKDELHIAEQIEQKLKTEKNVRKFKSESYHSNKYTKTEQGRSKSPQNVSESSKFEGFLDNNNKFKPASLTTPIFLKNVADCWMPLLQNIEKRTAETIKELAKSDFPPELVESYPTQWQKSGESMKYKYECLYNEIKDGVDDLPKNIWNSLCEISGNIRKIPIDYHQKNNVENEVSIKYSCAIDSILFCMLSVFEFCDFIPLIDRTKIENAATHPPFLIFHIKAENQIETFLKQPLTYKIVAMLESRSMECEKAKIYQKSTLDYTYNFTMGFYYHWTMSRQNIRIKTPKSSNNNTMYEKFENLQLFEHSIGYCMFYHFLAKCLNIDNSPAVFCPEEKIDYSPYTSPEPKISVLRSIHSGCNYVEGLLSILRVAYSSLASGFYKESDLTTIMRRGRSPYSTPDTSGSRSLNASPARLSPNKGKKRQRSSDMTTSQLNFNQEALKKAVILSQLRYSFMAFYFNNLRKEQLINLGANFQSGTSEIMEFKGICPVSSLLPVHEPVCKANFDLNFISGQKSERSQSLLLTMSALNQSCVHLNFNPNHKFHTQRGDKCKASTLTTLDESKSTLPTPLENLLSLKHKDHKRLKTESNENLDNIDINIPTETMLKIEIFFTHEMSFEWMDMSLRQAVEFENLEENKNKNTPLIFSGSHSNATEDIKCSVITKGFIERKLDQYEKIGRIFCIQLTNCHTASYCVDPIIHKETIKGSNKKLVKIYHPVSLIVCKRGNHFGAHGLLSENFGSEKIREHWQSRIDSTKQRYNDDTDVSMAVTSDFDIDGKNKDQPSNEDNWYDQWNEGDSIPPPFKGWHYDDRVNLGGNIPKLSAEHLDTVVFLDSLKNTQNENQYEKNEEKEEEEEENEAKDNIHLGGLNMLTESIIQNNFVTLGCDEVTKQSTDALDDPNACYRVVKYDIGGTAPTYHLLVKNPFLKLTTMFYVMRGQWEEKE